MIDAKIASGSKAKILILLFSRAGYVTDQDHNISISAATCWINGSRPCRGLKYFPNNQLNDLIGIYRFFRYRQEDKLLALQQILSKKKDDYSPIDCETKDMDIFCWSLINQFLDLIELPRVGITEILPNKKNVSDNQVLNSEIVIDSQISNDEAASDNQTSSNETANGNQTSDDETASDNQTSCDETVSGNQALGDETANGNQASDDEGVCTEAEFITSENNKASNINQTDSQNTFGGAQLSIPKDCKICLYCENWKGNAREALESTSGAYGRCIHLGKDMLSQELKCEGFIGKWGLITKYIHSFHDKSKL